MRLILLLFLAISMAACGGREPLRSTETLTVVNDRSQLPEPVRSDLVSPTGAALLGPLDSISIDVFGIPELSREMQIDGSGRLAVPLVGTVVASGKTAQELADEIEQGLRASYVRDPQVAVNVLRSVSQVVTVDGQVVEPGLYPVTTQMTLLRAISSAKGLTEFAEEDDVVILRTVGGQRMAGLYNISSIRRGLYEDPRIYADDVITVGDSPTRRLLRDLAPLIAAPVIALVQTF